MGIAGWADTDLIPRLEFESGEKSTCTRGTAPGANMGPLADGVTSEHYGGSPTTRRST